MYLNNPFTVQISRFNF